jgi:hypothetical protein
MAILLVTYDLKAPGRNYQPVHDYLKRFSYCKGLESTWLLDTNRSASDIRDDLKTLVDPNDVIFVVWLMQVWASFGYGCANWLNAPERSW